MTSLALPNLPKIKSTNGVITEEKLNQIRAAIKKDLGKGGVKNVAGLLKDVFG